MLESTIRAALLGAQKQTGKAMIESKEKKDFKRFLKYEELSGVKKHALVSLNNKCECTVEKCFCCRCLKYLQRYYPKFLYEKE